MDYSYSIFDRLKFGNQITNNKLPFSDNKNPIVIKDLNGNNHWVQINKKNKLISKPFEYVNSNRLFNFGISEEEFKKMQEGQIIKMEINGDNFQLGIDLNEKLGFSLKREIITSNLEQDEISLIKMDLAPDDLTNRYDDREDIGEGHFISEDYDNYLERLNRLGPLGNQDKIEAKINDLLDNNEYPKNSLFFIDREDLKIYKIENVQLGNKKNEFEFNYVDIENPQNLLKYYNGTRMDLDNITKGNLDQCLFFGTERELKLRSLTINWAIQELGINQFKSFGIENEEYKKLRLGETIEVNINNEKYQLKIDLNEDAGFSLKKQIEIDKNLDLEKFKLKEPILYEILNSYERLPFGEFSYNHLDKIQKETSRAGYDVKFNDEADISSITKNLSLKEVSTLVEGLQEYHILYFEDKNEYKIYDKTIYGNKELEALEYEVIKKGLINDEYFSKLDINTIKEVLDHKNQNSIHTFLNKNISYGHNLFFLDNRNSNVYQIDGIRNDGKIYFSDPKNPDTSFNYYEGKSFNIENIKNGKLDNLVFFNGQSNYVNDIEKHLNSLKVFEEFEEIKNKTYQNDYFQFDLEKYLTKKDLELAGGEKDLVNINRFIDYFPNSIEGKVLSRYEKEILLNSYDSKGVLPGIAYYLNEEGIVKRYLLNQDKILIAEVHPLEKNGKTTTIGNLIDRYKVPANSIEFNNNNQISNTMAKEELSANEKNPIMGKEFDKTNNDEIIIVVATNEQIEQYQKYLELIDNDKNQNLEKNIPVFSKEQIESIPGSFYFDNSKINLTDDEKTSLILKKTIGLTDNKGYFVEISVDKNNRLKISRGSDFTNDYKILTKEDLTEKKELIDNNQISNTMANEKLSANDIDVKGAKTADDKPVITYKEGDPVLVKEGDLTLVGIIKDAKDGNLTIDVRNNKEIKETKANEKDVEPLFYVNKEDQKIWLKFSYKEISRALNNTNGIKVKLENNQVMGLMAGEKSKVMPYQVDIDGKLANVEGRVFLRRNAEGNPYVAHDVKHNELNLDLPVYGVKLNEEQKQTLIQKGELGLVSGFKSGEKEFSLWVGLDKELNKVVTKRENDVYIDKVYGVQLSDMQKSELKKGNGVEIKDKNLFIKVSAAGTSSNSLGVYKTEKAIELGLMKKVEEKKNGKGTGMKM